jgi:hypothetical protein
MSRVIEMDHPWTADEIQYQEDRGRFAEIKENKKLFPPGSLDDEVSPDDSSQLPQLDQDIFDYVKSLDIETLQQELRAVGIKPKGDEVALKVAFAQHLQEERDSGDNSDDNDD